ncbi:hypothetical protein [Amycolatopsis sp.]|uniref:hypothetical protein n=1 Tax=Amycolatopsis sp. TaxID=37632 RepID=UPI002610A793|nr:hypothetical protein [Amycolatopsis sp.]
MVGKIDTAGDIFAKFNFWNTDSPAGGSTPAGGQGFSMSADEMHAMLTKAKATRQLIQAQFLPAERLSQGVPPANEPASNGAVLGQNGVNDTGRYYQGHLHIQNQHYSSLIQKLESALGETVEADDQAADAANKTGGVL